MQAVARADTVPGRVLVVLVEANASAPAV
jgi:hypothetical protein